MVFILVALAIAGFFFTPAWLGLAGYAIYIYASKERRRDAAVEDRVKAMVLANKHYAFFDELYFETAKAYAIAKGATAPEHDAASATMFINNRRYFVTFIRDSKGGTTIAVKDSSRFENEVITGLQERLENKHIRSNSIEKSAISTDPKDAADFVDSYIAMVDSNRLDLDHLQGKPTWAIDAEKVREFTTFLINKSDQYGVAEAYTFALFSDKDALKVVFSCVSASEKQGASFLFQKQVGVAIVCRCWEKLSEETKDAFREIELNEENM